MTIASEANRSGPYACNGVTTHFPYAFRIYDAAYIRVILTAPDGTESALVLGTDYTVSGIGESGGGAVDTVQTYAAGYRLTLILNVPFTQNVDLENQGAYFAETIERAIDLQTQMSLQLKEQVARSVVLPVSSSVSVDKLTGAVLSLADIQPQLTALAPIAQEITTVAGISGAVLAAKGNANAAEAAAARATGMAAEAAASAAAAKTWNPAAYSTTAQVAAMLGGYVPAERKLFVGAGLALDGAVGSAQDPIAGNLSADRLIALDLASKSLTQELWNAGGDVTEAPISPAKLAATIATLGDGAAPKSIINLNVSGTYTPSAGTKFILAVLIGGGGGSGGKLAGSSYPAGGYGGNGGLGLAFIKVEAGASYSYVIGAGGSGGSAGTSNGSTGGTTSITVGGVSYYATGGGGGAGSSSTQGVSGADGGCSASCLLGGSSAGQLSTITGSSSYGDAGAGNPNNGGTAGTGGRLTIVEFGT